MISILRHSFVAIVLFAALAAPASPLAQEPAPAAPRPPAVPTIEPDYRLVNLPTNLPMARGRSAFEMAHRFVRNLKEGSFGDQLGDLFGMDQGARVGLGYRRAITSTVQVGIMRNSVAKTIQFHGRWDAVRQSDSQPLSISPLLSIEGANNFREQRSPAVGAVVSHALGNRLAVYAVPVYMHHLALVDAEERNTFMVGAGGRARLTPTVYVVAEVTPRAAGHSPEDPAFAVAIEKRRGGHVFQLNFANNLGSTWGQTALGGRADTLFLGFNLSRKF